VSRHQDGAAVTSKDSPGLARGWRSAGRPGHRPAPNNRYTGPGYRERPVDVIRANLDRSGHAPFLNANVPGVMMITDTAPLRSRATTGPPTTPALAVDKADIKVCRT